MMHVVDVHYEMFFLYFNLSHFAKMVRFAKCLSDEIKSFIVYFYIFAT